MGKLQELTDKELMTAFYEAQEKRIGREIDRIKAEMNRRSKEQ